jgi:phosphoglycerate dehydrogenase-like enzyme
VWAVLVWVPDYYDAPALASTTGAEVVSFPDEPLRDPALTRVEFLVPPYPPEPVVGALPHMSSLRLIQTDTAGVEWIEGAVPEGVRLCNARGVHDIAVAEWVLAAILAMAKDVPEALRRQHRHEWREWEPHELSGSTVLIVGYGSIGRAVADRLRSFGVHLETVRRGNAEDLPRLLPQADVVVVLTPLTPQTRHLVDRGFLAAMRDGALLVNAARGAVVDTGALHAELEKGRLSCALDVTDPEPLPSDHPLWSAPGTLITPHVAGNSPHMIERATKFIAEQIGRYMRADPLLNALA